jgi:DNA-binding NarL/FixJ family response regulator
MKRVRLLLAEDHATVRDALRLLLETRADIDVVGAVPDGVAAVEAVRALEPDVALLDVSMPGLNGLAATREIKRSSPNVAIVALTRHSEPVYAQELLTAGASGYVLKQSPFDVLLRAISETVSGARFVDPAIGAPGSFPPPRPDTGHRTQASDRELSVLRLAASGKSNKDIAAALNIAVKTVEVHKANAMRKLQLRDRAELIQFAVMNGWLHEN